MYLYVFMNIYIYDINIFIGCQARRMAEIGTEGLQINLSAPNSLLPPPSPVRTPNADARPLCTSQSGTSRRSCFLFMNNVSYTNV